MNTSTPITYETSITGFYDLVRNQFQREKMLNEAIPNNLKIFDGDIERYQAALSSQARELEHRINPLVQKHFTLMQQIEFLERYKKGEFKNEESQKENPQTEIPTRPQAAEPASGAAATQGGSDPGAVGGD